MIGCRRGIRERRELVGHLRAGASHLDDLVGMAPGTWRRRGGPLIDKLAQLIDPSQIAGTVQPAIEACN